MSFRFDRSRLLLRLNTHRRILSLETELKEGALGSLHSSLKMRKSGLCDSALLSTSGEEAECRDLQWQINAESQFM